MFLVFDTETTGLPKNYNAAISDVENWPRVIQLAWALYDREGILIEKRVDLIRPDGWSIPTEPFWIENGFDQKKSEAEGIPIREALMPFLNKIEVTTHLIAHNLSYDHPVLGAECVREDVRSKNKPIRVCTKEEATDYCKIPGNYGFKWPTLSELHIRLFGEDFENSHDALADVEACAKCFFELLKKEIIK